jgi:hypothetical protein
MTSDKPFRFNLQIQVNKQATEPSLNNYKKPGTVATVLVPSIQNGNEIKPGWTSGTLIEKLREAMWNKDPVH